MRRLSELHGASIEQMLAPFAFSVDSGATHAHMAALCTSNLGSRCHHLDTVMTRQRFTAERLCEPARIAQDAAIEEYEKYKDVLDIKIECRYHNLFIYQPAALRVHAPFLFLSLSLSFTDSLYYRFAIALLHTISQ